MLSEVKRNMELMFVFELWFTVTLHVEILSSKSTKII